MVGVAAGTLHEGSIVNLLISGGTGSIGKALTSFYLKDPRLNKLIIFSRDEWKQAEMAEEFPDTRMRFFLGDVRDPDRLRRALYDVSHVIHAAALKRVDAVSYNPSEVVKTNVGGTINLIDAAIATDVSKVLVISSDKAVCPTNIYGGTKMLAEHYAVDANSYGKPQGTLVSCVRYGNVLGSRGSVVHVFKRMAENGGIKLTDPRCTRFLITMPQACELIAQSFRAMKGGEIFVPKLPSISIFDLADVVDRAGKAATPIEVTGLRHGGEKLHEQLLNDEEVSRTVQIDGRYIIGGTDGLFLPADFRYSSDTNPWRLTRAEIADLLSAEGYL